MDKTFPGCVWVSALQGSIHKENTMDCSSCQHFEPGLKYVGNHYDTRNENDKAGRTFLYQCSVVIIFLLTYLFNGWYLFFPALFITVAFISNIAYTCYYKPIRIVHAASSLISSTIRTPPKLDPRQYFSGTDEFEDKFALIKAEVMQLNDGHMELTKNTFQGENEYIGSDVRVNGEGKEIGWRIFTLSIGSRIPENARRLCPTLVSLLTKYSHEIKSCVISVLPPHTKIPQHVGYYKGVLRYMLAIHIPQDRENVYICVNDTKIVWEEGKSIMFDDTYPHKVYNATDERRIVIYMDIVRPLNSTWKDFTNQFMIWITQNTPIMTAEIKRTEQLQDL